MLTLVWHPTASDILATACTETVVVWNVAAGAVLSNFQLGQSCFSLCWNDDGSYLCSVFKDKKLRILDPRKNEVVKVSYMYVANCIWHVKCSLLDDTL